ncbi:MAG: hypothetical protein GWO44_19520, partial [Thermoplasmata archaeon]|nr:hypothetical protein [Thermoplasmata archaeon]NIY05385.1 hypothetical protein [Thermoplasmata archaeon]
EVQQGLAVYGGGVLSSLEATYYEYYEYGIESENLLGVYGGAEFSPSRNFALGVEVHALSETAFGAYADYRF